MSQDYTVVACVWFFSAGTLAGPNDLWWLDFHPLLNGVVPMRHRPAIDQSRMQT